MSELQDIKTWMIENPVRARNNSWPWNLICWRLARVADDSKSMAHLLHSTNNKERNIQVGVSTRHKYWVGIIGTWHSDPLNIHSSYYSCVGTWHPIHYYYPYSFSSSSLLLYQGIIINREGFRFKLHNLIFPTHYNYIITSCKHTIKHIEDFTILPNTYHSPLRVYYEIT